jgi:hypothetical protein
MSALKFERGDHVELAHALLDVLRAGGGEILCVDRVFWRIDEGTAQQIPAYVPRRIVASFAGQKLDGGRVLRISWGDIRGATEVARMICSATAEQADRVRGGAS